MSVPGVHLRTETVSALRIPPPDADDLTGATTQKQQKRRNRLGYRRFHFALFIGVVQIHSPRPFTSLHFQTLHIASSPAPTGRNQKILHFPRFAPCGECTSRQ
jgi:hypothetical protein